MDVNELVAADEAAELLGVQRRTIYAYVSRGQLARHVLPGSRQSWFDPRELEQLKRGDRAQHQPRRTAASELTHVTSIVDDRLLYQDRDAIAMARQNTFEGTAEWLWRRHEGPVPPWRPSRALQAHAEVVPLPELCLPVDRLKITTASLGAVDALRYDLSPAAVLAVGRSLLASLVGALPPLTDTPPAGDGIAEALWPRLTAAPVGDHERRLLDAALIVSADHGLAPSTRAARIAAATAADPYSVVLTGMSVASGLEHGGSSLRVHSLLNDIAHRDRVHVVLSEHLRTGAALPGFGQPRYTGKDPRAAFLLELALGRAPDAQRSDVVRSVADLVRRRNGEHPNIEFALGALCFLYDMVSGAGEAIFVLARSAGWLAHAIEEYAEKSAARR
ncbi:citrate synthase [Nonomuraea sp. K274]|uniref:citrate synthase (unknown stereospecificity) n=1 Tax=Nonomuraea cypriaca TaxID=1187855 RepID=A0A931A5S4_9ACTN|nr:citrate synthase [Nonomuraea cypriaca]MBF8185653.1 citrate synthase [Nonomuraea cypriaca]